MIIRKLSLLSVLSATAFTSWAQSGTDASTITVTANRFQQPVNTVLAPVSVVTREQINRWQSQSLTDVMRRLPGVDFAQNGGMGQKSSLFIRGTSSSHVLILVDGIRLNQAGISGSSDLSQFPLGLVQRIEYIRGPRSAIYGSDAIGGVINIITRNEKIGTTLNTGIGSNNYQTVNAATQQDIGDNTRVALAGAYTHTRGFDVVAQGNYGDLRQPDHDGYLNKTLYGSVSHRFSDEVSGFVRGFGFDNRTDYDGYYDAVYSPSILVDTRQLYSQSWDTGLNYHHDIFHSQLIASYGHSKDYNYDPRLGRYASSASLDDVKQYNLQSHNSIDVGNGNIGTGIEWQKLSSAPGTSSIKEGYDQRNTGIYLNAAQRVNSFSFEGAVRNDDNSQFGNKVTWQGSSAWEFIDGYRLIASYGTGFKAPNFAQLYSTTYGNRDLKPEQSKQWEGGVEGLTSGVTWRISGYRNLIDNLIESSESTQWRYYNVSKATIKGVEAAASFDTGLVSHEISYDYVDARNGETNEVLIRRAKQQVKYQLDWTVADIDWSVTYHYLGIRYDTAFGTYPDPDRRVKMPGVSLWDLAAAYPVTSHLTIRGRIANLFDKNYETVYGYHTAGREYFLSGSYTF